MIFDKVGIKEVDQVIVVEVLQHFDFIEDELLPRLLGHVYVFDGHWLIELDILGKEDSARRSELHKYWVIRQFRYFNWTHPDPSSLLRLNFL